MEDESGRFLEFRERATKTRTGESKDARPFAPRAYANECNPARCPVELYHIYASHRPLSVMHDNAPFFLAVNNMLKHDNDPRLWFKVSPLGQNTIGSFMRSMAVEIGLKGKYTNHSVRKTSCTNLLQAGVSPTLIQQISGHKDVKSLTNYATASREQIREMGAILSNPQSIKRRAVAAVSGPKDASELLMSAVQPRSSPVHMQPDTCIENTAVAAIQQSPSSCAAEPIQATTASQAMMMLRTTSSMSGLFTNAQLHHCSFTINMGNSADK